MKKILFLFVFLCMIGFFGLRYIKASVRRDLAQPVQSPSLTPDPSLPQQKVDASTSKTISLFVPYWTLQDGTVLQDDSDQYIYFGIVPGKSGIDEEETGSKDIPDFLSTVPQNKKKLLALRMINSDNNFAILKDTTKQSAIIARTIAIAKKNDFDGIVLDLEISAIPFDSLINQINSFTSSFYSQAKKNHQAFTMTVYGDTSYRLRPFDIKTLSHNADTLMVMSYDFSKANGNPGPNFPLHGKEKYGYDLTNMSDDFLQFVPAERINIVFGLYGYDWLVDGNGNAAAQGKPLTYLEITQQFLNGCMYNPCVIKRDSMSSETEIKYTDKENKKHIVWFEDMDSVAAKEKYLQEKGITHFGFWANGYF